MNILALTISLLLIFAISSSMFFSNSSLSKHLSKSYKGYMQASRQFYNTAENSYYNSLKGTAKPKDKSKTTNPSNTRPNSPPPKEEEKEEIEDEEEKERIPHPENAKINLYPLIKDEPKEHSDLYELASKVISLIYADTNFFKTSKEAHLEYIILNEMIRVLKQELTEEKSINDIYLNKLSLKDEVQHVYYKMLKGSKDYNFNKHQGFGSLLDFFCISSSNQKNKLYILDVREEVLTVLFNENVAKDICTSRKDPEIEMSQEFVESICQKNNFNAKSSSFEFLDFASRRHTHKETTIQSTDDDTHITIKRKSYL